MVSIGEIKPALNCWSRFVVDFNIVAPGKELPPTPDGLLAWSRVFAVKGTFCNYLCKLSLACQIAGVDCSAFEHPALKRAKRTIGSLENAPRPKRAVTIGLLEQLVSLCSLQKDLLSQILYLVSYIFLLRVPSEALPLRIGAPDEAFTPMERDEQSKLFVSDENIRLRLAKRKNKPNGSFMTRTCWCASSAATCPVHVLGRLVDGLPTGKCIFGNISSEDVRTTLRARVKQLRQPGPHEFNTHDFRRGHARDLANSKASTVKSIMQMGEWTSSAMIKYLNVNELEAQAVIEAHIAESESEHE